jgi:peptidoglycan/LPS O-acetylase OafA/YrhL
MDMGQELTRRSNNLDALRLGGALLVILGHSYVLLGSAAVPPRIFGEPLHGLGVHVFFIISGYLISKSWLRRPDLRTYLAARALRIFPALVVAVVLTVFVAGPVLTTLDSRDYFASSDTWSYLRNAVLQPVYGLPGVFDSVPYPSVVNGSLWTLPVEFACYLVVPLLLVAPRVLHVPLVLVFAAVSVGIHVVQPTVGVFGFFSLATAAVPWIYFAGGMLVALLLDRRHLRLDVALLGLFVVTVATAVWPQTTNPLSWIVLPYAVLALGLTSTPVLSRSSRFGDFSYGLYVFAFPVQQLVIQVVGVRGLAVNAVVVTLVTLALAAASWYAIEAPALKVKTRLEARFANRARERQPVPVA